MARCIDADKLLEYLEKAAESEDVKYSFIGAGVQATINEIKKFHREDVAPVVHAHWNEFSDYTGTCYAECSRCGLLWWIEEGTAEENEMFYCPKCGAKMDEKEGKE